MDFTFFTDLPLLAVFSLSLFGSGHCAGMCGGFAVLAAKHGPVNRSVVLFHLGRLSTYLTLAFLAGLTGFILNSSLFHQASLTIGTGWLLYLGYRVIRPPSKHQVWFNSFNLANYASATAFIFPLALGVVTALLPCGWLYGFLALALSTGEATRAAGLVTVFWLGTLPILSSVGISPHSVIRRVKILNHPNLRAAVFFIAALSSIALHCFPKHQTSNREHNQILICNGKSIAMGIGK